MAYLIATLNRFKEFSLASQDGLQARHAAEEARLSAAIPEVSDEGVRAALSQSLTSNEQSLLETRRVHDNMINFASSMESLLRAATSSGSGCEQTVCGEHASCTDTTLGTQCVCNEGYVGTGHDCHAPPAFMPHRMLFEGTGGVPTHASDIHVGVFDHSKVALVFRDKSKGDIGRMIVGSVREAGMADLSPPEQFTEPHGKAFNPVVVGTDDNRVAVAWRDENRKGNGWIRGAALGITGIRGADMSLTWSTPRSVSTDQGHKMALVSLVENRVALLFSDKTPATVHTPQESFGNSVLAEVGAEGQVEILGAFRFSEAPTCRLEVTKVGPSSFVLAGRAGQVVDDMDSSVVTKQEAVAIYGEMVDNLLVFNPNFGNVEPSGTQIWARSVSLIAPNTIAYAYQQGSSLKLKMAILRLDPVTHRMEVVARPAVVREGFSPYVHMLSVPYTPSDPHTLIYHEDGDQSRASLCAWKSSTLSLEKCESFTWLPQKVTGISGAHLGGGKSFLAFTTAAGTPFYTVMGLSKK